MSSVAGSRATRAMSSSFDQLDVLAFFGTVFPGMILGGLPRLQIDCTGLTSEAVS
jgi:hypothetical protein